ncbi:MAG: hypothetical protein NTV35_16425, partial [Chloroflexi bacterium]|nr:hypothetical protein [Chloroflexota bacterium]
MIGQGAQPTPGQGSAYDDDARLTSDREVVARAWALLSPYHSRLWISLALMLLASAATLLQPRIIQFSIDRGILQGKLDELNLWA